MATLNFDARSVPPSEALEPLPAGWYNVKIVNSENKPTKDGSGEYLELQLEVLDGPCAKRKLWDRLNLRNNNQVAVEIAYRALSAICHAVNIVQIQDTQQLHGIPLQAKVSVRNASTGTDGRQYDATNEIKGYKPIEQGRTFAAPPPGSGMPAFTTPPGGGMTGVGGMPPPPQASGQPWANPPAVAPPAAAPWAGQPTTPAQQAPVASPPVQAPQAVQPAPTGPQPAPTAPTAVPPWAQRS
jgi:hypothetical protein